MNGYSAVRSGIVGLCIGLYTNSVLLGVAAWMFTLSLSVE